jgi:hypothetical protein
LDQKIKIGKGNICLNGEASGKNSLSGFSTFETEPDWHKVSAPADNIAEQKWPVEFGGKLLDKNFLHLKSTETTFIWHPT